jgi:hypothetical protein
LRSTISNIEARQETIPSRTWSRSAPPVTRKCIASRRNMRTRSCCLACSDRFAVLAPRRPMCVAGNPDHKQENAELHQVVRNDTRDGLGVGSHRLSACTAIKNAMRVSCRIGGTLSVGAVPLDAERMIATQRTPTDSVRHSSTSFRASSGSSVNSSILQSMRK